MATEQQQRILSIRVDNQQAITAIQEYKKEIDSIHEAEDEWKEALKEGEITQQEYDERMTASTQAVNEYNQEIRVLNKEIRNNIKTQEEENGSLTQLRAQLSNLTKEYDKLSREERENGERGKELRESINATTKEIKSAEEATTRYYRNVGNYENSIRAALGENNKYVQSMKALGDVTKNGLGPAMTIATDTVKGFGKQLLALLANPIVLTIAGIAAAFKLLSDAIKNNEENTDRWKIVMAPLGRLFELISNQLQKLAGAILSVVEAGGKMMNWVMGMMEKVPVLGGYFRQLNDEMRDSIELEREAQSIRNAHRKEEVEQAKASLESQRLLTKAYDKVNYSAKQRLVFLRQATKIEQDRADAAEKLAKRELELAQRKASISKNDTKTNDELAAKEAAYYQAQQQREALQTSLKQREGRLIAQIASENNKAASMAKANAKEEAEAIKNLNNQREKEIELIRKAEDAMMSLVDESIDKQRKAVEIEYTRRIEDLKRTLETEKTLTTKGREAISQTILLYEEKKLKELARLADEEIRIRTENEQTIISNILQTVKKGSEQELDLKRLQLDNEEKLEVAKAEKEVTDTEERERVILSIHARYNAEREKLDNDAYNAYLDKMAKSIETKYQTAILEAGSNELEALRLNMEMRQVLLSEAQRKEGESIEEFNLRKLQLEDEYLDAKKDLADKEVTIEKAKADAVTGIMGGVQKIAEAFGEDNEAMALLSKTLALGEIAINSGVAISAGVKQAQSLPYPANLGAIATTVATILANIATAIKTVKSVKFAQGGYVTGAGTGTSDSIAANLSNGESVMTSAATSMFSPLLSAFNQLGGGAPIIVDNPQQAIGEDMLASAVAKGMSAAPRPVVSVQEITEVSRRVEVIEDLSSF